MIDIVECDVLVVGGGVIGSAIAYKCASEGMRCILLEKEFKAGLHTSARNSEVIHAGLYYPSGTFKNDFCLKGKQLLYEYLDKFGISYRKCGKYIFSSSVSEDQKLFQIMQKAYENSVDIVSLSKREINELPNYVSAYNAIFSPTTGILDSQQFIDSLLYNFEQNNGLISYCTTVEKIEIEDRFQIATCTCGSDKFVVRCHSLINAAGANALDLIKPLFCNKYMQYEDYLVKGHYFNLNKKLNAKHLYYPIPTKLGLGVHLTIDLSGAVRFGPDTVETNDAFNYSQEILVSEMFSKIAKNFSGFAQKDLAFSYCGVRPKLKKNGNIVDDFLITFDNSNRIINLLGMESPGLTASLSVSDYVSASLNL